jgi:hypothetical protein
MPDDRIATQENLVVSDLQQTSWTNLEWARLHVREMQEGHFKEHVIAAIQGNPSSFSASRSPRSQKIRDNLGLILVNLVARFSKAPGKKDFRIPTPAEPAVLIRSGGVLLDTSSSEPRPFAAVQRKLRFTNDGLNCAAARQAGMNHISSSTNGQRENLRRRGLPRRSLDLPAQGRELRRQCLSPPQSSSLAALS